MECSSERSIGKNSCLNDPNEEIVTTSYCEATIYRLLEICLSRTVESFLLQHDSMRSIMFRR